MLTSDGGGSQIMMQNHKIDKVMFMSQTLLPMWVSLSLVYTHHNQDVKGVVTVDQTELLWFEFRRLSFDGIEDD